MLEIKVVELNCWSEQPEVMFIQCLAASCAKCRLENTELCSK